MTNIFNMPPYGATVVNLPVPFSGTPEQAKANYLTHNFHSWFLDDDLGSIRCTECDCKKWHRAADYPCGTKVPRMIVITTDDNEWEIKEGDELPTDLPTHFIEVVKNQLRLSL